MHVTTPKEVRMRGDNQEQQGAMWSYVPLEQRIPGDHPLRRMRPMVDAMLEEMSPRFDELYSRVGRPSTAPETLLRAPLLHPQALAPVRVQQLEQLGAQQLLRGDGGPAHAGIELDYN